MGFYFGGVGGIRTLGRLVAATRFPVAPVMTASIPLHMKGSALQGRTQGRESSPDNAVFLPFAQFATGACLQYGTAAQLREAAIRSTLYCVHET